MQSSTQPPVVVIGSPKSDNFWLWTAKDGYDLTHPPSPGSPPLYPRVKLYTTNTPVTITPPKTAMIVIDMQNYFLSPAMGRNPNSAGHKAERALLDHAIPAARKAGIQVIWLTWGVREEELEEGMLPTMLRIFRVQTTHGEGEIVKPSTSPVGDAAEGTPPAAGAGAGAGAEDQIMTDGIGSPIGNITLEDGSTVDGGRRLMRGAWNTRLHPRLEAAFDDQGLRSSSLPDVRFDKDRLSGMWGASTPLAKYLRENGFTTLLFAGVNTDQCVHATMQDAVSGGWDCVLLRDGCGTSSPDFARRAIEFNSERCWGFVSTCEELKNGVDGMVIGL